MMMNERYTDPEGGFLLYLQGGPLMKFTQTQRTNKSGLLQMRNKLSKYLSSYHNGIPEFPDPSSRYNFCEKCPMLLPCSLAERAFEGEKNLSSAKERQELVMGATRHLSNPHLTYFRHWFGLIHLEALAIAERNGNKAFWSIPAPKREDKGMCLCNLRIAKVEAVTNLSDPIKHTFSKLDGCSKLTTAAFRINDTLVVSTENSPSEIAIAIGSVSAITEFEIQLLLDKNLTSRPDWSKETFTIDIYNSASLIATNFRNVARLMMNNPKVNRLRALIIDKEEPNYLPGLTKKQAQVVKSIVKGLNKNQLQALFKSLLVQDYVLIQGMPGTGKTYTIICIVKSLVALGLSVLLTSYTNSAVDNILLKLKDSGVDFMRMGRASKVHPDLSQQTADSKTASIKSPEDLAKLYNSVHVVATTCLSVNDAIFHRRTFDVCIVDEASQILQPVCLGPLFLAKSFILVGDSKQLPPLAQSFTAREKGICESLFSSLERTKNVVELNMQYRMNSEIMDVSNKLTYDNKLIAGNAEVANSTLQIKLEHEPEGLWSKILSNELRDSVVFLNTNEITSEETNNKQGLISNKYEAAIVVSIVEQLVKIGKLCVDDLGIISPYRDQIRLITEKLQKLSLSVEINTVDQYQGRDKNVIIFSCVRSSVAPSGNDVNVGEILQDSKRLNVALTRAKTKLILIGDQETLKNYMPFANLFKILRLDQIVTINESFLFKDLKCFI